MEHAILACVMFDEDDTVLADPQDLETVVQDGPIDLVDPLDPIDPETIGVARPPPFDAASIPPRLAVTDTAPQFRRDLVLTRTKGGGADVRETATGKSFTLNEYEHSLARMLDGRRTIAAVLEAGHRLGIPLNLDSVAGFIQRLQSFGCLETQASPAAPSNWPTRGQWEEHLRSLFQSGVRLLRSNKPAEAAGYFQAMLVQDPDNVEALELLAMAEAAVVKESAPVAAPVPSSIGIATIEYQKSRRRLLVVASLVAFAVIGMVVGLATFHTDRAPSTAPLDARGQTVMMSNPPPRDAAALPRDAAAIIVDAAVAADNVDVAVPVSAHVIRVQASIAGQLTSFLPIRRDVKQGEVLFQITRISDRAKYSELSGKVDELTKLVKQDSMYVPFLANARSELAKIEKITTVIKAPHAGTATPHVKQSATVRAGQLLFEIALP